MVETMSGYVSTTSEEVSVNGLQLAQLGRILLKSIPVDKEAVNSIKVMMYIARQAVLSADDESVSCRVSTKAIHTDLNGNPNQNPSAWLSPLWKEIEARSYKQIKASIIDQCREMGLATYPILKKVEGNPAYYTLAASKIPDLPQSHEAHPVILPSRDSNIEYKKDLSLKLSTLGRLLFQNGMTWTPVKRFGLVTWQSFLVLTTFCIVAIIGLSLWLEKGSLTIQDLLSVFILIAIAGIAYRHITDVWKLFEDRIVIAPDWALAWSEWGATIEITRSNNPEHPSTIEVNRYSSTCPICGWMVKLDNGKPDFSRRLVGRCIENPREHVFSFDRSTKLGMALRTIPNSPGNLPSSASRVKDKSN